MGEVIRNKALAKALAEASNGNYCAYEMLDFLELFPAVIQELTLQGHEVRWTNFGAFKPKYSNPKVIKSTLRGASYDVPAGVTLKFQVSETFQRDLKGKYIKEKQNE